MTIDELKRAASALPPRELAEFAEWVIELREETIESSAAFHGRRDAEGVARELEPLPVLHGYVPPLTKDDLY